MRTAYLTPHLRVLKFNQLTDIKTYRPRSSTVVSELERNSMGERIHCGGRTNRCGRSTEQQTGGIAVRILTFAVTTQAKNDRYD